MHHRFNITESEFSKALGCKTMKRYLLIIFYPALLFGCAAQQDVIHLDNRLSQVEITSAKMERLLNKTTDELESRLASFGEEELDIRSQSASLNVKIDSMREELRVLSGKLEEVQHQLNQGASGVEKNVGQLQEMVAQQNERLLRVEKYLNLESTERKTSVPSPIADTATEKKPMQDEPRKDLSDTDLYLVAKKAFDQADYESARQGFEDLLKRYPSSPRASNAQFWLGETYYQEKWYEKAILEYQKVIDKYPSDNKVPAALLKQGFAFLNLGDKTNARLILKELSDKYPGSNEAAVAKKKLSEI
jgi:tol-pal system protein YbgF